MAAGVRDLAAGATGTAAALLVRIAAPRLRRLGVAVPRTVPRTGAQAGAAIGAPAEPDDPERALYLLLAAEDPRTAHGRYNAMVRRVTSFARAYAAAGARRGGSDGA